MVRFRDRLPAHRSMPTELTRANSLTVPVSDGTSRTHPTSGPAISRARGAGQQPSVYRLFISMIDKELGKGENVMLDPDGMSPGRLAHLQQVVADHPEWQGKVVGGS